MKIKTIVGPIPDVLDSDLYDIWILFIKCSVAQLAYFFPLRYCNPDATLLKTIRQASETVTNKDISYQ